MKLLLILSLGILVGTIGCKKVTPPKPTAWQLAHPGIEEPVMHDNTFIPPTPEEQIAAWKAKAKEKKLYWFIRCTLFDDADDAFIGRAGGISDDALSGMNPYWFAFGKDQAEVAAKLSEIVDGAPNHPLRERKPPKPRTEKQCPPPLTGKP